MMTNDKIRADRVIRENSTYEIVDGCLYKVHRIRNGAAIMRLLCVHLIG
jgi:hypothetical protein